MANIDNVPIFQTGVWNGIPITEADLDKMVVSYDSLKSVLHPPLKLGHNDGQEIVKDSGLPAVGWIDSIKKNGKQILATITDVPDQLVDVIKKRGYRFVSAEVLPSYSFNGQEFPWALWSVALLGCDVPAIKTLGDISALFNAGSEKFSSTVYCFSDNNGELTMTVPMEVKRDDGYAMLRFADSLCNRLVRIGMMRFAGSSEGARKGWESRKGGGGDWKPDKPADIKGYGRGASEKAHDALVEAQQKKTGKVLPSGYKDAGMSQEMMKKISSEMTPEQKKQMIDPNTLGGSVKAGAQKSQVPDYVYGEMAGIKPGEVIMPGEKMPRRSPFLPPVAATPASEAAARLEKIKVANLREESKIAKARSVIDPKTAAAISKTEDIMKRASAKGVKTMPGETAGIPKDMPKKKRFGDLIKRLKFGGPGSGRRKGGGASYLDDKNAALSHVESGKDFEGKKIVPHKGQTGYEAKYVGPDGMERTTMRGHEFPEDAVATAKESLKSLVNEKYGVRKFAGTAEGVKKAWETRQRGLAAKEAPGIKIATGAEKAWETRKTPSAEKAVGGAFKATKGLTDTEKSQAAQWKDVPLTDLQKMTEGYGARSGGFEKYVPKAKTEGWSENKVIANKQVGALEGRANAMVKNASKFSDVESKRVLHAFALFLREKASTIANQRDIIK